jgi:hypothetical protein
MHIPGHSHLMKITPLRLACPKCGSSNVAYSCEPDCCFNHVCEDCLDSFQLATRELGRVITGLDSKGGNKDSCAPTAKCAKCHSLDVRSLDSDDGTAAAVCASCGAVLELEYQ